jgi:hypothetical protein
MNIKQIPNTNDNRDGTNTPSRLQYIKDSLDAADLPAEICTYRRAGVDLHNLYCQIPGLGADYRDHRNKILITAHWDTVRSGSDNCLDNTASLYNLYNIALKIHARKSELKSSITLAWTDAEEECSTYLNGAVEAAIAYDPRYHLDLELTAGGKHIIVYPHGQIDIPNAYHRNQMPLNNATMVWSAKSHAFLTNLKGTACVTLVDDKDLVQLQAMQYCDRWAQCHRGTDTFDNWLNLPEMEDFANNIVDWVMFLNTSRFNTAIQGKL